MNRVVLLSVFMLPALVQAAGCDASVGTWKWFNGGSVTLTPQKTVLMNGKPEGKWDCTDPKRGLTTVRWNAGFVDTLTVDGNRMTGKNQQGIPISADRKPQSSHK